MKGESAVERRKLIDTIDFRKLVEEIIEERFLSGLETPKQAKKPRTMAELCNVLMQEGENWRKEHKRIVKKTGKEKIYSVPTRTVADIMLKHCDVILIEKDNPDLSPLAIYDLDEEIYKTGNYFITDLAMCVERTLTKGYCNQVKFYLRMDSEEKEVQE